MKQGLERAVWPARMELVRRDPDVILDGGHNPQCMEALSQSLRQLYPDRKIWFLTGVLADKDYGAMFEQIIPLAKGFVTITPDSPGSGRLYGREGTAGRPLRLHPAGRGDRS